MKNTGDKSHHNVLSEKNDGPQVTSIRIGAQKLQHKFALKGPVMTDAEMQANGEVSVGTFIKDLDGSELALTMDGVKLQNGEHGILSFKSI